TATFAPTQNHHAPKRNAFKLTHERAAVSVHLSQGERSASEARRVRGYRLSRVTCPLTTTLSPERAFTPVFDGLWGRGSAPCPLERTNLKSSRFRCALPVPPAALSWCWQDPSSGRSR